MWLIPWECTALLREACFRCSWMEQVTRRNLLTFRSQLLATIQVVERTKVVVLVVVVKIPCRSLADCQESGMLTCLGGSRVSSNSRKWIKCDILNIWNNSVHL